MGDKNSIWVGTDESSRPASMDRPDAPKANQWSLEAIASVGRPHDPVLSSDGQFVSVVFDRDTSDIWVVPVSGGRPLQVTTGRDLAPYWADDPAAWSPNGKKLTYSAEGSVWVVDVAGAPPKKITAGSTPIWISDRELVVSIDRDDKTRLGRVRIEDSWPVAVTAPGQNVSGVSVSVDHQVILYVDYPKDDRQSSNIWLHDLGTGKSERLTDEPGMHDLGPKLSPDGKLVAFTSERSGWYEIYGVARDGSTLTRITSDDADFSELAWHPAGRKLAAIRSRYGRSDLVTVDSVSGEVIVVTTGGTWSAPGWTGDDLVALHESHNTPPRLVVASQGGDVTVLLDSVPLSVSVAPHKSFEEIRYESFDGAEIHGFLFRPETALEARVPVVVYPHGGPTSAYTDGWDGHAQYFVEKGYAWLAINFRGSTGYGREFERANHGVWGVADTEDCLAAADYLAGLDWVDSSRIAIFGASYGAYMALASLARDPQQRFACGVAKYGDSDIATSWSQCDRGGREDLERMMGRPAENREAYRQGSPLWMVENIQRPILIAHGEKDEVVHPDQSEQLVAELRRLEKTYEYVTYPTEGHGLLRTGPQVHFYKRLERFLDWYLM